MDLINILFAKALNNGDATKEYVDEAIKALKGEVNADLDTLEELSKALGNDPDFFLTIKKEIDGFKTELVTNKDAATENTRFAIGVAEQNLEVPSMEEFNQLKDGKLSEPTDGLAVGKYFRVAALDENGHAVLEAVDAKTVGVQDVQLAGESVVADGVANVPLANGFGVTGVVNLSPSGGIKWSGSINALSIDYASQAAIAKRSSGNNPIIPYYLDYAVKTAMCDGKGAAWTADEQAAARERIGAADAVTVNGLKDEIVTKADKTAIARTDRSLDALWKLNEGITYQFETDNNEAYQKQVISGAKLADIQSVGGKTVVWNQYDKGNWFSYAPSNIPSGSVEKNGGEYTYTIINLKNDIFSNTLSQNVSVITGHKYYQSFQIKSNKAFNVSYSGVDTNWIVRSYSQDNVYKYYRYIQTASTTQAIYIGYNQASSNGAVVGDSFSVKDIILIDLTQMFGAGNEPTSTDDSRIAWIERYAAAHPEYNAGELVSADVESVKYNDAIIADIPASVRALPGYGWSAGSVYNSIERTESGWQYIQRVGSVDLGSLSWIKHSVSDSTFYAGVPLRKANSNNIISSIYAVDKSGQAPASVPNKHISGYYAGNNVWIQDTGYTNAYDFKEHLSGRMLYYELAEPIITDITPIIEEPFEVESGGTITYENAAKLAIPNSIEYTVKLSEVGA